MTLAEDEIEPGAVAYFEADAISRDDRVDKPVPPSRTGPCVCVQAANGRSVWSPLTTQFRKERLLIAQPWRLEGSQKWQNDNIYLNDGANTYVGPDQAFVDAAKDETPFTVINRPRIADDGVKAIIKEIEKRHGKLL